MPFIKKTENNIIFSINSGKLFFTFSATVNPIPHVLPQCVFASPP